VIRPAAIVVDPARRVRRSVAELLARLGFEVHSVRGIALAALALGGAHTVTLVLVSADPPADEASESAALLLVERARTRVAHARATCRTYAGGQETRRASDRR
jgi:hypothetical protein